MKNEKHKKEYDIKPFGSEFPRCKQRRIAIRGCLKSAFGFNDVINIVLAPTGKPVGYKDFAIF